MKTKIGVLTLGVDDLERSLPLLSRRTRSADGGHRGPGSCERPRVRGLVWRGGMLLRLLATILILTTATSLASARETARSEVRWAALPSLVTGAGRNGRTGWNESGGMPQSGQGAKAIGRSHVYS